jgi:CHASE2 domain-containing sensor protein
VICGSTATGNDLTDRGATPLGDAALYVGQHWNLANSLLTNRFVRATPLPVELLILLILGVLTSWLTWRLRAVQAILAVLALAAAYCVLAVWAYLEWRLWLPMWLPVLGAAFFQHVCLVTYRVVFEEREKRKVRSVFAKVVSRTWFKNSSVPRRSPLAGR